MVPVTCSSCRTALDEAAGLEPGERRPCPICGSTVRTFPAAASFVVDADVIASASAISASLQSIAATSHLLLKAVVVPGEKTAEGTLIQAVAIPWFEIIERLRIDPNLAFQIPARTWEEIIAGAYHKAGFE